MDVRNIIALSMVKGIGSAFIKRNISRIASDIDCKSLIREYKPEQEDYIQHYLFEADKIINDCELAGIEIISILSSDYPKLLKEISDPPCVLYVKGNKNLLQKCIAIIGTRNSSSLGNKIAEKLGSFFSKEYSICNGLVEGIDEHSIYVNGVIIHNVIGIISGGLCYKETCTKKHASIIDDVLNGGGLIITEYPPHVKEDKYSGSKASRIQAGLSQGLILVQSNVDGGSKYTISSFSKLGRHLGIIHFPSSKEYNNENFSANILIANKKIEGIAEMIEIKNVAKINIKSITIIQSKNDYASFVKKMKESNVQTLQLGL